MCCSVHNRATAKAYLIAIIILVVIVAPIASCILIIAPVWVVTGILLVVLVIVKGVLLIVPIWIATPGKEIEQRLIKKSQVILLQRATTCYIVWNSPIIRLQYPNLSLNHIMIPFLIQYMHLYLILVCMNYVLHDFRHFFKSRGYFWSESEVGHTCPTILQLCTFGPIFRHNDQHKLSTFLAYESTHKSMGSQVDWRGILTH